MCTYMQKYLFQLTFPGRSTFTEGFELRMVILYLEKCCACESSERFFPDDLPFRQTLTARPWWHYLPWAGRLLTFKMSDSQKK